MPNESKNILCPVCGYSGYKLFYDLRTKRCKFAIPGLILKCSRCLMVYKHVASVKFVEEAYGEGYADCMNSSLYGSSKYAYDFFRKVLKKLRQTGGPKRLLDIGTGTGLLLVVAQSLGYKAEGIDCSRGGVDKAKQKGLDVKCIDVCDINPEKKSFNVITLMDNIEHLLDPISVLKKIRTILGPEGQLVIYTPNHRSFIVAIARFLYKIGITFPINNIFGGNHVCFFDERSLKKALNIAGFEMEYSWRFTYNIKRPGDKFSFVNLLFVIVFDWFGWLFGRSFRIVVYAKKTMKSNRWE